MSLFFFPFVIIAQESQSHDVVIRNGKIIDGTGKKSFHATVVINNGIISEIERDTTKEFIAKKIIDARGYLVTPGFIDTHSHGDPLETPAFENFLAMGVTTISLGQDGFSPEIENFPGWIQKVNSETPGVNIAMFAGHNSLRQLSGINYDSVPRKENMKRMEEILENAMRAGAFGLTTGLEYSPGEFSQMEELLSLARVVGENKGIIMSHMRNEDDSEVEKSISELLELGLYCPVHISHIKVVYGKGEERGLEILEIIDEARKNGIEVTADIYPYTASYTGIAILFPDWAKLPNNYEEVVKLRRKELSDFLRKKVIQRNGPESTLIGTGSYRGQTLAHVSSRLKKPYEEILMDEIGPYGAGAAHFIMDETLQRSLLSHPVINICSDGSPSMRHPRGYGSFPKIIETYVLDQNLFSLEEAIQKMTGLAAGTIQLNDRGILAKGKVADILVFKAEELRANATYEEPHQLAAGMKYVIVNGKIAVDSGNISEKGHGKVLKKNSL
ncbi:MAG TPA: amidohydrolase family protein [Gillisia sp.]|nr:amidohydrolase family protein [Gillisia sp.]